MTLLDNIKFVSLSGICRDVRGGEMLPAENGRGDADFLGVVARSGTLQLATSSS